MKRAIFFALTVSVLITSCSKVPHDHKSEILKGPVTEIYEGKAWTWVQQSKSGVPERMGVTLSDAILTSVPVGDDEGDHSHHEHSDELMWNLKFHPRAAVTPFKFLSLGWNPVGHEPLTIYGKPHFDFHFYMMTQPQVEAIPPYDVDSLKFKNWPATGYFPANYINPGGGVPQMGTHWVDITSGEFNGLGFSQTFIFGSYDGKVNFYEPMITLDFLKMNFNFERSIPQPSKVQQSGYYPKKMRVVKHDGLTEVILDDLYYRSATL